MKSERCICVCMFVYVFILSDPVAGTPLIGLKEINSMTLSDVQCNTVDLCSDTNEISIRVCT